MYNTSHLVFLLFRGMWGICVSCCFFFKIPKYGKPDRKVSPLFAGLVCLNSYLYAIGGYDGQSQLCSVERYNIARNVWDARAPMHHCRSAHGVAVYQGRIFVLG